MIALASQITSPEPVVVLDVCDVETLRCALFYARQHLLEEKMCGYQARVSRIDVLLHRIKHL